MNNTVFKIIKLILSYLYYKPIYNILQKTERHHGSRRIVLNEREKQTQTTLTSAILIRITTILRQRTPLRRVYVCHYIIVTT